MGAPSTVQWSDLRDSDAVTSWDSLPDSSDWDTAFGTSSFLGTIAAHSNAGVNQVTVADERGVSAAARVAVRRPLGLHVSPILPFTAFSAIRLRDELREAVVHARESVLEDLLGAIEQRFCAASIHIPPPIQDARILIWRGWKVRPLYTYRIALQESENPLESWSESARRTARQESSGFEIAGTDPETQARLVVESYARNGRQPPLGVDGITEVVRLMVEDGAVRTVGARSRESGEIEASIAILQRGREAYYWLAGGRRGAAMTVLLANVLPDLASSGTRLFDFVGANTASIAEFKRKFGGQLTTYFRATWQRGVAGSIFGRRV
ncbi:MAG TPA: GNAT family N-acetyltransferase [Rhodothermales bacterium]|nr:GNAT family N-acetyltransferase [Rhodothermales bacterium]